MAIIKVSNFLYMYTTGGKMSFLSLSPIGSMASNDVYQIGNNQRATFKPNLWESGSHQANVRKYSKNLMLIYGKPEIRSEAKLSETELIG